MYDLQWTTNLFIFSITLIQVNASKFAPTEIRKFINFNVTPKLTQIYVDQIAIPS